MAEAQAVQSSAENSPENQKAADTPAGDGGERHEDEARACPTWYFWGSLFLFLLCTTLAVPYLSWGGKHAGAAASAGIETRIGPKSAAAAPAQTLDSAIVAARAALDGGSISNAVGILFTAEYVENTFQSVFVLLLTFLTFCVHGLDNSRANCIGKYSEDAWISNRYRAARKTKVFLWGFFGIPTFIFFCALIKHGNDEAAVFLMAVVAIYVAAEHYVALEGTVHELERHTRQLDRVRKTLETEVEKLQVEVSSVKNAIGTSYSQEKLYAAYGTPSERRSGGRAFNNGIYAVYRLLDPDREWLKVTSADRWPAYCNTKEKPETLYAALLKGRRTRILVVTGMPFRIVPADVLTVSVKERVYQFQQFVGLLWHTVVLRRAARALAEKQGILANYEIQIGKSSNWMHVVDETVFQLFGEPPKSVYLRDLSMDTNRRQDNEAGRNLAKWAVEDIQRVALRGISSVDYLCAAVSHALLVKGIKADTLYDGVLVEVLDALGFSYWCKERAESAWAEIDVPEAQGVFVYLINSFLQEISDDPSVAQNHYPTACIYRNMQ